MKLPRWEVRILELGDATVLVECGPMRMFIEASVGGAPRIDLCRTAAEHAVRFLEQIAANKGLVQSPAYKIPQPGQNPLIHVMWEAANLVGDPDLTPMAAVAGTIADATADILDTAGMTRVVVNNGGDVAIRLKGTERVAVGIRPDVEGRMVTHRVVITSDMNVGGVCTSGLGGRSFTRGVASAATVFASRAAVADAAATAVANATFVADGGVHRELAEHLDPNTDIRGLEVTVSVGDLGPEEIETALCQGIARANRLVDNGLIAGACVTVKGRMQSTEAFSEFLEPLERPKTDP